MNCNDSNIHTKTFFDHYNDLPTRTDQKLLRKQIIENCKISRAAFYKWFERNSVPDEKNRKIISEILEIPIEQLLPEIITIQ